MPTFRKDIHLGHEVPMIDSSDINDKVILGRHIMDRVIDWFHIKFKAIRNEHIDDGAVDTRTLDDGAVTTPKIADGAVTPEKLSDRIVPEVINPLLKPLKEKDADLQNQIDSFNAHGLSVSNQFGNNQHIGISQKTLTLAFNKLWQKLEDITGEVLQGISMAVTPSYYIGEEGCTVNITADTVDTAGIFEYIKFYLNGELIGEAEEVHHFETETEISDTSVVRCEAQILGIPYEESKTITHYASFWLGAGTDYTDIMDNEHLVPIHRVMRCAKDITASEDDRIFIVIGESLSERFIRADINGAEIPMTEETVTIEDVTYKVFTSENTYQAGTYNIDING